MTAQNLVLLSASMKGSFVWVLPDPQSKSVVPWGVCQVYVGGRKLGHVVLMVAQGVEVDDVNERFHIVHHFGGLQGIPQGWGGHERPCTLSGSHVNPSFLSFGMAEASYSPNEMSESLA